MDMQWWATVCKTRWALGIWAFSYWVATLPGVASSIWETNLLWLIGPRKMDVGAWELWCFCLCLQSHWSVYRTVISVSDLWGTEHWALSHSYLSIHWPGDHFTFINISAVLSIKTGCSVGLLISIRGCQSQQQNIGQQDGTGVIGQETTHRLNHRDPRGFLWLNPIVLIDLVWLLWCARSLFLTIWHISSLPNPFAPTED